MNFEIPSIGEFSLGKKKPKILLLSDDLRSHSGVAAMSREIVLNSVDKFDWVQLGAALKHPEHGRQFDISEDVRKLSGVDDASVKIFAHTGYGNQDVVRELIELERPDAILHFTDPRFWLWLYQMEYELRVVHKIPLLYYNIWDAPPAPFWNEPFYRSCDGIANISKQTHALVTTVLDGDVYDPLKGDEKRGIATSWVPHGVNDTVFTPINENHSQWKDFEKFKKSFLKDNEVDFVIFWNNRNIRRKAPGDVILAFELFRRKLPKNKRDRVALLMKTDVRDPNGTDLGKVANDLAPDAKIIFNEDHLSVYALNAFYNLADVVVNMASNEGFGLSTLEAIMAGTPIIVNVTGGLQDQVRFEDENGEWIKFDSNFPSNHTGRYKKHGKWAKVVFPAVRTLQGSIPTPYIFDDKARFEDVAEKMLEWYKMDPEERRACGLAGREWVRSDEAGMTARHMGAKLAAFIQKVMDNFTSPNPIKLEKIEPESVKRKTCVIYEEN